MGKPVNKTLIIDVESTCWEDNNFRPAGQFNDIIEIGIALYDLKTLKIIENDSIIVFPRSEISSFCTKLTGHTEESVRRDGILFEDALALLRSRYKSHKISWMSWGDYDRRQFERQCKREDKRYPFSITHTNLKHWFAVCAGEDYECIIGTAIAKLAMNFEGTPHRGVDDALNIARILTEILIVTRGKNERSN